MEKLGVAGNIAKAFINSKLTPLIVLAALLLGVYAVLVTPREEEPQIVVPMIDVYLPMPGSTPKEVEERVVVPFEKVMWELPGVEYVYSMSRPGMGIVTVRFLVGEDMEKSLVKLYNKVMEKRTMLPPGAGEPMVVPKSIDDVPILTLTLWSDRYDSQTLRRLGRELCDELKKGTNVAETRITGGLSRQLSVRLDSARLAAYSLSPLQVMGAIQGGNARLSSGSFDAGNRELLVDTGGFIASADDARRLVVSARDGRPVYLSDVATVVDGPEEPRDYVSFGLGPAADHKGISGNRAESYPAVTLSVAKRKGANATWVAEDLLKRVEFLKGKLIPSDVQVTVTRNYGETAKEKNNELLFHMFLAAISVTILIAVFMGWRAGAVAAIAIPVTLALTMLVFNLIGYTLNRITLFALIFSIGILVDDAIVVVENIHRYFTTTRFKPLEAAIRAVDEIGNPTVLATFAVIASILPMGFVGGLMGPYMRPIPVGASMAMLLSMFIAFMVTPYFAYRLMKGESHFGSEAPAEESKLTAFYRKWMGRLIHDRKLRYGFLTGVVVLLLVACSLIYFKLVTVKMLPFDNKNELQVIIDAPEGTPLEETARMTAEMAEALRTVPEVTDFQTYVGTSAPFNFNGLVRHYYLRSGSNVADIQVNFVHKEERTDQSHALAKRIRPLLKAVADRHGARIKVAEVPPGPPVLSTLVTEVYGPDQATRLDIARKIKAIYQKVDGVVDTDWYVEDDQQKVTFAVDREKAALSGIAVADVAKTLRIALAGMDAGIMHLPAEKEPVPITLRLPVAQRSSVASLSSIYVPGPRGNVPLSQLVRVSTGIEDQTLYRKNLKSVVYVTGDVAGTIEAPVYAILKMQKEIDKIELPGGYRIEQRAATQPWSEERPGIKWDGEWHITYEVFRDLGLAFGAVMILIYLLVVAWFRDFTTPLVIMAPIPLTLIGILPGHALFGAFFTATSMIGFIALAGIIVRNSIILIDFAELKRREGLPLDEAIIEAGAVRFRPMLLTAAAVVVGSFVIVFDPIFQGLALAMMFGEIASTTLSRVTIPILYYMVEDWKERHRKGVSVS
ncbi:acriflavin resistance protein [Geobacter metallireducens RCH3]|uniref:Efflux pump, RND family, inner membrane protein n=1 Tax=Geobacter metallireducens (strain ATCC 53774 / DSM 7210 / GS-15) TaxID=269799 RepID=Q39QY3_GEOMG|nr:efflux RND transporter permease subunit [Geobacter metallireducens]ABB33341.1 efflux pump, RND family, inner membrane protein [Geobacter metallireducens GS-15]EHP84732.1 acriflavin resistance protein [Geobacter metallireducens RCH3]